MEDQARYMHPSKFDVDAILNQAANEMGQQLNGLQEDILRQVLRIRKPALADLPSEEIIELLTAYVFGPGHTLLVESESGEPILYLQPAETKMVDGHLTAVIKYMPGHAGAQEFYRIRAQYHVMD